MAVKAKRFRIGVEGATTDGRTIERAWLEQMAASYNPQVYTALINLEHIKGYTPDSPFRRFGTVDKLEAEEIADGPLKGKWPCMRGSPRQMIWWRIRASCKSCSPPWRSIPVLLIPAKRTWLASATDDPASLGTEMLQFSASAKVTRWRTVTEPGKPFTAAEETLIEGRSPGENPPSLPASPRCLPKKSRPMMRVSLMCIVLLSWSPPSSRT
jgi:hypothetical protein